MTWVLIGLATLAACEILRVMPFQRKLAEVSAYSKKAARTVTSGGISDHWKERALPAFALRIGTGCILLLAMLIAILIPYLIAALFFPGGMIGLTETMLRPLVLLALIAGSAGYLWLRARGGSAASGTGDYSANDKFLHRMALGNPVLPEVIHDVERGLYLKKAPQAKDGAHVFVCGLARAGTTVLTRELFRTGQFGSLTYRDMPFVLAPNLWSNLSKSNKVAAKDRAHGDGLQVDLDSPEALDEVFWRVTSGDDYIGEDGLAVHTPHPDELDGYADFIRLVLLRTGKARYLSKNNNNILRLRGLARTFPNASFLIPVRDPLQHAKSLMTQHERFADTDAFEESYFRWLAHHEFGKTHRPFLFEGHPVPPATDINYWLTMWVAAYSHLQQEQAAIGDAVTFVSFEQLCSTAAYREALLTRLAVPEADFGELRQMTPKSVEGADPALVATANALYAQLSGTVVTA